MAIIMERRLLLYTARSAEGGQEWGDHSIIVRETNDKIS